MVSVIICSERVLVYDVRNIDLVQSMKVIGFLDLPLAIQYQRYAYEFLTVTHCSLIKPVAPVLCKSDNTDSCSNSSLG